MASIWDRDGGKTAERNAFEILRRLFTRAASSSGSSSGTGISHLAAGLADTPFEQERSSWGTKAARRRRKFARFGVVCAWGLVRESGLANAVRAWMVRAKKGMLIQRQERRHLGRFQGCCTHINRPVFVDKNSKLARRGGFASWRVSWFWAGLDWNRARGENPETFRFMRCLI